MCISNKLRKFQIP
ncbi:Protein CBG25457 [Caenorhabditis briggsae]|uniref:Protein CBG25457 n=1 Tax=Caenorhabditis briggsae TaxID=6238 RepID=B6IES6_CAEBR|nr:Protein CBG25457 [Caenorhabditis briggsae]CAR98406.1 Protein CBG25457 [Caenorhabditis briggsae]